MASDVSLPDAPLPQDSDASAKGSISGTVTDPSGATVSGALVTLVSAAAGIQRTTLTHADGKFSFADLSPGEFQLTVVAKNFIAWVGSNLGLSPGQNFSVAAIKLQVGSAATEVDVTYSQAEIAEQQLHAEEKQRVLGILPNFDVSYVWNAAPLTVKQKFQLAFRSEIDPVSFLGAAVGAGYEQSQDDFNGYGQGARGFFKRFGASYTDGFDGAMIGSAILPSLLHQDPRYFYKGTGTNLHRALYAVSTVGICKGDNGKWQPNYSNVLGALISGAISNAYYPDANRGAKLTIDNALLGLTAQGIGDLIQEFLIKKISTGVPANASQSSSGATP